MYCFYPPGHENYDPENKKPGVTSPLFIIVPIYYTLFDDCPACPNTSLKYFVKCPYLVRYAPVNIADRLSPEFRFLVIFVVWHIILLLTAEFKIV